MVEIFLHSVSIYFSDPLANLNHESHFIDNHGCLSTEPTIFVGVIHL